MPFLQQSAYRPFKVVDFNTNRKGICDFLLVINSNFGPILHRFWDTVIYLRCRVRVNTELCCHNSPPSIASTLPFLHPSPPFFLPSFSLPPLHHNYSPFLRHNDSPLLSSRRNFLIFYAFTCSTFACKLHRFRIILPNIYRIIMTVITDCRMMVNSDPVGWN